MTHRGLLTALLVSVGVSTAAADGPLVVHDVRMNLDPNTGGFRAVDRVALSDRPALRFSLTDAVSLDAVSVDGRRVEPAREHGAWSLVTGAAKRSVVHIHYSLSAPGDTGSPHPAWRDETFFLPAGAGWVPDIADTRQHYRLRLEVPAGYRALATGRLAEEAFTETAYRAEFVIDYPSEPPSVFAGRYTVNERIDGKTRLRTYFPGDLAALADDYLEATAKYLRRFRDEIGAYAYADFFVVASPYPVGLSFPGLTYVSRRILPLPYMRTRSLAHEILHSWWGNGVYVDYAQGNWSEGLTTYQADYAIVAENADAAREMRMFWLRDFAALPPSRDTAPRTFTAKAHDAAQVIGYNKVAFFFHMLRDEIGAEVFDAALRRFWSEYRFRTAGWMELRRVFEQAAQRDLRNYFAQWLERPGAPRLELRRAQARPAADGHTVRVELAQSAPFYTMKVPLRIDTEKGAEWHTVPLQGATAELAIHTAARPLALAVDPDYQLFRRLDQAETPPILRDVTLSDAVTCVLAADGDPTLRAARSLADRLLDVAGPCTTTAPREIGTKALLIVGGDTEVAAVLARLALDPVPAAAREGGDARVWTQRLAHGGVALVITAANAEALMALQRPLPHYGRKSYLVFKQGRAQRSGVWPVRASPLSRAL